VEAKGLAAQERVVDRGSLAGCTEELRASPARCERLPDVPGAAGVELVPRRRRDILEHQPIHVPSVLFTDHAGKRDRRSRSGPKRFT